MAVDLDAAVTTAAALAGAGDLAAGIAILTEAIACHPHVPALWAFRARMWRLSGQLDRAGEDLTRATSLDPDDPYIAAQFSWWLWVTGDQRAAKTRLRRVQRRHPRYHWAHAFLAQQHLVTRQFAAGERAIERALALEPRCSYSLRVHADLLANRGELVAARAIFDRVLAYAPTDAYAHAERGLTLGHQGDLAAGIASLANAIELLPRSRQFWRDRGALHILHGDLARALDDTAVALQVSADREPFLWHRIAQLHHRLGDRQLARNASRRACRMVPIAALRDRLGSVGEPQWTPAVLLGRVGIMDQLGAPLH